MLYNSPIWFNKTCSCNHLTPKYIHIKADEMHKARTDRKWQSRCKINHELKFLYKNKTVAERKLYKLHLKNRAYWNQNL